MNILFASSEVYPLAKTGGLADVSFNLPKALIELGADVRIVTPAYHDSLSKLNRDKLGTISRVIRLSGELSGIAIIEAVLPQTPATVWLVEAAGFSDRPGNPYTDPQGVPWQDNAQRFSLFCDIVSRIAIGIGALNWLPDVVHCNDWHTGLVPAQLSSLQAAPASLFTVHNIAYQGLFPYSTFIKLGLDHSLWHYNALEFYNQLSFIKGGLIFSDWVNTVSPQYAKELTSPEFGYGLDGVFRHRQTAFSGIINGIDTEEWDPLNDRYIKENYSADTIEKKSNNTAELQKILNLPQDSTASVLGWVGRLTQQKGLDVLLAALADLVELPIQLALVGNGDKAYEQRLKQWARQHPDKIAVYLGYNEAIAHHIIAGAHFFLMPSEFEPCGLTQMYSLRYGTVPIAHNVGGLVDTIVNINRETLARHNATGFLFKGNTPEHLLTTIRSAIELHQDESVYRSVQLTAMAQDFSWQQSARQYLAIYQRIARQPNDHPLTATALTTN